MKMNINIKNERQPAAPRTDDGFLTRQLKMGKTRAMCGMNQGTDDREARFLRAYRSK